jgi:hypothetical protein
VVWDPVIIIFDFFLVSKPNWAISKYSRDIFVVFSINFSENLSRLKFKKKINFSTVFPQITNLSPASEVAGGHAIPF